MTGDYLQPADVARLLAVSQKKVLKWIRSGALRAANLNDNRRPRWIIRGDDLDAFVRSRQPEPSRAAMPVRRIVTQSKRF